ncbi:hypothetical protein NUSPORA_01441 [Nucleospora cyclopteri]
MLLEKITLLISFSLVFLIYKKNILLIMFNNVQARKVLPISSSKLIQPKITGLSF